jgi:hypothetical protein
MTLTGERDGLQMRIDNADAANPGLNQQVMTLNGQIMTLMGERDALQTQVGGFATAYNARTSAAGAAEAAADAVTAAMEASVKITTKASGVAGDSAVAEANAVAVMGNRDTANDAG